MARGFGHSCPAPVYRLRVLSHSDLMQPIGLLFALLHIPLFLVLHSTSEHVSLQLLTLLLLRPNYSLRPAPLRTIPPLLCHVHLFSLCRHTQLPFPTSRVKPPKSAPPSSLFPASFNIRSDNVTRSEQDLYLHDQRALSLRPENAIKVFNSASPLFFLFFPSLPNCASFPHLEERFLSISSITLTLGQRKAGELISLLTHAAFSKSSF